MLSKEEEDRGDDGKPSSSQCGQNTAVIVCLWISNFKKLVVNIKTSQDVTNGLCISY
jgi:hypothetical protein